MFHPQIPYFQFDEWSSDEEVTIYTGIEKGYEQWLEVEEEKDDEISEHGLSEDEEVVFNTKHTVERSEYDDTDNYIEYYEYMVKKDELMEINDEITDEATKDGPFKNENLEPEPEKPEKATRSSKRRGGGASGDVEDVMEVNMLFVPKRDCTKLRERLLLARLVPGLENSAIPPEETMLQVWMVQIGGSTPSSPTPTPSNGPSSPGLLLRPGPSGVTRPGLTRVTTAVTTLVSQSVRPSVRLSPASPAGPRVTLQTSPSQPSPTKKIQYICKQGGQTFIIESAQVLEKLRGAGLSGGTGSVQLRLPISAVRPTMAVNNENKSDISLSEGLAGRLGTLLTSPKPQLSSPKPTTTVSVTLGTSPAGKAILGTQAVLVSAGLTQTKAPTSTTTAVATEAKTGEAGGPADLIRQLNLARAQGLVVLQQWGDKQVLVHKATGRWIMRQGSRLVTVPPQALGISTEGGSNSTSSSPGPAISSRTMEQLAEFDSILESKFKTESGEPMPNGGVVVVSGAGNTRQVIQLPTTPLKKELVLTKEGQQLGLKASPVKSPLLPPAATFPKPQEDPETMKRIQAILDDYNDQIRNSPDLHNRPAPRRRTNGSGSPESPKASDSPPRYETSSKTVHVNVYSSSPGSGGSSPSMMAMQCEGSPSPALSPSKVMKALRNLASTSTAQDPLTVAMAEIKESGALTLATQSTHSPSHQVTSVRLIPKSGTGMAGLARGLVVQQGGQTVQRLMVVQTSGDGRRMVAVRPVVVSTNSSVTSGWTPTYITVSSASSAPSVPISVPLPTRPVSPSRLSSSSPPRPSTPGLGIPMEMTPGQIMEAEISATLLDDPSSPYACSSMPDNVFSAASPGPTSSRWSMSENNLNYLEQFQSLFPSCPGLDTEFDQVVSTSTSGGQPRSSSLARCSLSHSQYQ